MANLVPMTAEREAEEEAKWAEWAEGRPAVIQALAARFRPWKLYWLATSGHRVVPYSFMEDGTVSVAVLAQYNLINFERRVFGIDPNDLVECDLPEPGELVGETMTPEQQLDYINKRRAENGLPALTQEELDTYGDADGCVMDDEPDEDC